MRKNVFVLLIAGSLMVMYACEGSNKTAKKTNKTGINQKVTSTGLKIAYYNQDSLKTQYNYYRIQDSIMALKGEKFQKELERKQQALETYIRANDLKAQQGLLSQQDIMQIQQKIQEKQNAIVQYQQREGLKIENETIDILETIGNRIEQFGKEYCEENEIDILVAHTKGGQFTYINPGMDVTEDFIQFLNKKTDDLKSDIEEKQ